MARKGRGDVEVHNGVEKFDDRPSPACKLL